MKRCQAVPHPQGHEIVTSSCPLCFQGHATSFFGPTLERYSSFQVNSSDDIRQIQSLENGVLFLTKTNLKYLSRGGLIIFDYL